MNKITRNNDKLKIWWKNNNSNKIFILKIYLKIYFKKNCLLFFCEKMNLFSTIYRDNFYSSAHLFFLEGGGGEKGGGGGKEGGEEGRVRI